MAEVKWTQEQLSAIEGTGGSILVTAAAGSGKTAVLTERVVRQITRDQDPVDADKLLVVTFSNAAAAEMKRRISRKLWEISRANPDDNRLARQQILLESAQISTIHSFCITLLHSYFQKLNLPASFRIGEEQELNVLRMQTVKQVLETHYAQGEDVFFDLVELLSTARNDNNLERTVLQLYDFVRNHPFYHHWLDGMEAGYAPVDSIDNTPWAKILLNYAGDAVDYCLNSIKAVRDIMTDDDAMQAAYGAAFDQDFTIIERCAAALKTGGWETVRTAFAQAEFGPLGRLVKYPDEGKKKLVQKRRGEVKDLIGTLRNTVFTLSEEQCLEDNRRLQPLVSCLCGIVKEFDDALSKAKLERNLLDFSDLEHYTLALLYDEKNGKPEKSSIARQLSAWYEEILVDEYQDTNDTQEMIFSAISRDEKNLFMVGDVKQSIYRFRQARPEIFLRKKNNFSPYDGNIFPAKIALNANFRTRQETTGLINYLFSMTMNPTIGEMHYEAEDRLEARAVYEETADCAVHMTILDTDGDMQRADTLAAQARWVAQTIADLLNSGMTVQGTNGVRPLEPGDVCILLRSPKNRAEIFEQELQKKEIGCWSDRQGGFLETLEIAPVVAYLRLIINPLLDLELAKALCSPLYSFSSDDLGRLRSGSRKKNLFVLLQEQAQTGDLQCQRVLEDYEYLRRLSVTASADEVLAELYRRTSLLHKVQAMPQGSEKRANLQLLSEYAASYRQNGEGSVDGLVSYLTALEEYGYDLPSAYVSQGDSVSIMSVHKSKGLEFPVVFFCDTSAQFNMMDLNSNILLHPDLGFACILRDNRKLCQHKTLQHLALGIENKRAMLSEELRILYVALTRAKEHLYLVATDKGLAKLETAASRPLQNSALSPWTVRSAISFYDWMAAAFAHHPQFDQQLLERPSKVLKGEGNLVVNAVKAINITFDKLSSNQGLHDVCLPDESRVEQLHSRIQYRYPFPEEVVTPAKLSVSQLTHREQEAEYFFARRPKVLLGQKLTPTERGIAAHKFMQFADFAAAAVDPEAEITRLGNTGFITREEAAHIDRNVLTEFFKCDVGKRILSADKVYREIRFLKEFSPIELQAIDPSFDVAASTVIQGVADCVFLKDDIGTVVDYKTDIVKDADTLRTRYASQLRLYKAILEEHLNIDIKEMFLYSFALQQQIFIE